MIRWRDGIYSGAKESPDDKYASASLWGVLQALLRRCILLSALILRYAFIMLLCAYLDKRSTRCYGLMGRCIMCFLVADEWIGLYLVARTWMALIILGKWMRMFVEGFQI